MSTQPDWIDVLSSNIARIARHPAGDGVLIDFGGPNRDGRNVYHYARVPQNVFDAMAKAASKGKFFHQWIKPSYPGRRLDLNDPLLSTNVTGETVVDSSPLVGRLRIRSEDGVAAGTKIEVCIGGGGGGGGEYLWRALRGVSSLMLECGASTGGVWRAYLTVEMPLVDVVAEDSTGRAGAAQA